MPGRPRRFRGTFTRSFTGRRRAGTLNWCCLKSRTTNKGRLMPQAIVDPAELKRFAHNLKQFNNELHNQILVLHGQLVGLGDSWRDQEHEKFVQEFEDTMRVIQHFVEASNEHVPFLLRKAERIEEYLQQR